MKNLDGLTVVRFLAALWVFFFHFQIRLPIFTTPALVNVVKNGALAMPIFFMLSGFVLAYRYKLTYNSFSDFLRSRVARIYPAYIIGVMLSLPFISEMPGFDIGTAFLLVPIDILMLQAWYPNLWSFWHHAGTWSISVEFFLYASFPLILNIQKLSSRELFYICAGCTLLASSWIPSLKVGASSELPFPVFYATPIYSLPVFIIGVALAEFYRRGFRGHGMAPLGILALLMSLGQFNSRYAAFNIVVLPLIALSLLFAAQCTKETNKARLLINPATIYLGDISYAFFIYQIPLLLCLETNASTVQNFPVWITFLLMLSSNFLLAATSHRYLEPWGGRLIKKFWGNSVIWRSRGSLFDGAKMNIR